MISHIKFITVTTILTLLSSFVAYTQNETFIRTEGKNLIGPDGKPFLIRGTNLGNWLVPEGYMFKFRNANSPKLIEEVLNELIGPAAAGEFWAAYLNSYITEEDIHFLRSTGMNSIRVPFNYRLFTDETYLDGHGKERGFALMDRLIGWCRKEHLYVILDMHAAPGGQTGDNIDDGYGYPFLFDSRPDLEKAANVWKEIADHYKDESVVLGYDLLNEPIAHFFDTDHFNPLLEPAYKYIAAQIRQVDKNHILILGGAQWDSNFKPFGPPFDPHLVYTFHKYWTPPTKDVIQSYIDFRDKYNVPIYCGETGENTDDWVRQFRILLEDNNIGWHFWPYKKIDNTRGIVTFSIPPYYDEIIHFADTTRSGFEQIRKYRPKDVDKIKQALQGFLTNSHFKNCVPNKGYIKALGLNIP
jgi:hypothetical protein